MVKVDVKLFHTIQRFLPAVIPNKLWKKIGALMFDAEIFYSKRLRPSLFPSQGSGERLYEYSWVLKNLHHKGSRLLDVGCGDSLFGYKLVKLGFEVYAIDLKCHPTLKKGGFTFVQADITRAPFKDNSFDWILAVSTIEHIEDDTTCMKELCRMLADDGTLLVTVPLGYPFYDSSTLNRLLIDDFIQVEEQYFFPIGRNWVRVSKNEVNQMIKKAGKTLGGAFLAFQKR
ncbi:MAG: hypothetical protein DRJ47_11385 [Thermoprotei archaeon]|nr:MAG: hypothetical protein DRJ47_11385 [Thermoprotei archaeon]